MQGGNQMPCTLNFRADMPRVGGNEKTATHFSDKILLTLYVYFFMRSMLIANSQLKFVIKRNQEEKSFQSKQEKNSESIRNVLQNKRIHLKQENNKRNLFIQSKKTT